MDTQTQRKRQFQEIEEKQQKKQVTRGQSVATEVRIPALPSSDSRVNPDALDSFRSHHDDADNRLQKLKQQKIALPVDTSSDNVAAPSTIPQCQFCQRLARALHPHYGYRVPKYYDTQERRFVRVCSWQEILRNENCPTCSRVAELLSIELQSHGGDSRSAEYDFSLYDYSDTLFLTLVLDHSGLDHFFSIHPLPRGIPERVGVLMDQCWIDFERVLQWIKSCDTMHADCHWGISVLGTPFTNQNMYLICVSRKCLVKADSEERYIALSYVWGTSFSQFRATKANITFLQSEGSLNETRTRDHLPGTIERAMHFTTLLNVDFLWVDSLCIVQDDPIHAASQIDNMASIYSNSYLTLCAADGVDAESGLLGIRQCSPPRNVQQDILTFADGPISSKWVRHMHPKVSAYNERGWTFQEQVLSRRSLSFTGAGLEWRCREVSADEQRLEVTRWPNTFVDSNIVRADTLWPCLKKWDNLVYSYLTRKLTYEEDILRAFSGTLKSLSSGMLGGFLFGLPQQFFDAALLWVPEKNLTRREDMKSGVVKTAFPSWSWAGWKGATNSQINAFGLCHERSNPIMDYKPRIREIYPCVTWYKIDMDTFEKVRIPSDYARFRTAGLDGTIRLPLGWTSYHDSIDSPYYYRYDNAPDSYTFWYPIPTVRDIQAASDRQWGPILYFKTSRGYLEMGSPLPQEEVDDDETFPIYSLHTSEGTWAGVIYVHHSPESASEQNQQCELVLISGGWAVENNEEQSSWFPEWNYKGRPRSEYDYDFYHVLWIEWQDNIAYRRGLGRVVHKVWHELPTDKIELFLG